MKFLLEIYEMFLNGIKIFFQKTTFSEELKEEIDITIKEYESEYLETLKMDNTLYLPLYFKEKTKLQNILNIQIKELNKIYPYLTLCEINNSEYWQKFNEKNIKWKKFNKSKFFSPIIMNNVFIIILLASEIMHNKNTIYFYKNIKNIKLLKELITDTLFELMEKYKWNELDKADDNQKLSALKAILFLDNLYKSPYNILDVMKVYHWENRDEFFTYVYNLVYIYYKLKNIKDFNKIFDFYNLFEYIDIQNVKEQPF